MSPRLVTKSTLPADLSGLAGLRAARWTRESTGKPDPATGKPKGQQWDNFGPDAQREQQDRAIERYELVDAARTDVTLNFQVAHSGRTIEETPEFRKMLERAGVDFDVLVVGYASRFSRNLRTAVNTLHDMHACGAVILFADEHLLSSDERRWKDWAEEAVEAEAYSRKLGRRLAEGHAAKRRRLGEPGGRPPFGFERDGGRPPRLVELAEPIELVRSMFRWAAEGLTDHEVAARSGLKKTHVSEILTNRIYDGVLSDGSRRPAVIEDRLWDQVQEMRSRHSRRHPGPTTYRNYQWSGLIYCRACGRGLSGHVERYRHVDACEAFRAARPGGTDARNKGESYKAEVYDSIAHRALALVVANASLIAELEDAVGDVPSALPDQFRLARIRRDRRQATQLLTEDRDTSAWNATMERLDREEAAAKSANVPPVAACNVAESLADLQTLFAGAEPLTRHRIVQALFDRVEVLGPNEVWLFPSVEAEARGWAAAMRGTTSADGTVIRFVHHAADQALDQAAAS